MRRSQITQRDLAELLGISQPAVSLYLQGRVPPPETLIKIAKIGKTSIDWLLTGEEPVIASNTRTVREPAADYSGHQALLRTWVKLPRAIQRDLLTLMRHIAQTDEE